MTGELAHSLLKWNAWKWMGSIALVDGNGIDGDNHVVVVVVNTLLCSKLSRIDGLSNTIIAVVVACMWYVCVLSTVQSVRMDNVQCLHSGL
jgi:hypothetical protein